MKKGVSMSCKSHIILTCQSTRPTKNLRGHTKGPKRMDKPVRIDRKSKSKSKSKSIENKSKKGKNIRKRDRPVRSNESQDEYIDDGLCRYTRCLHFAMCLSVLSVEADMFGFSVIARGSSCSFEESDVDNNRHILDSAPLVGPIVMAGIWGYLSDTKGRKWTLLRGLWGGCIVTTLCGIAINEYMLGALKIISTSFSSAVQTASFSFVAESCPERVRSRYILIMSAAMNLRVLASYAPAHFILTLNIMTTPWPTLCYLFATQLGISAILVSYFCKSPNSLGKKKKALKHIWKRNKGIGEYLVKQLKLIGGVSWKQMTETAASLWAHLTPLFKPPLLWTTLKLFYLISVVYGINNSLLIWMPLMAEEFLFNRNPKTYCGAIIDYRSSETKNNICLYMISYDTSMLGVGHGLVLGTITLAVSMFGSRKKIITIIFLLIPMLSAIAEIFISNTDAILAMYIGMMTTSVCMGTLFAYIVELYPTAYTGMAVGLGMMVSRVSSLIFIQLMDIFLIDDCDRSLGFFSVYLFTGAVVAYFLPEEKVF